MPPANVIESMGDIPPIDTLATVSSASLVAPDCRGMNFYEIDQSFSDLISMRLPKDVMTFLEPHLYKLGQVAGNALDKLAMTADQNKPILNTRTRYGANEDWVEYHPAYREMEQIAFCDFGIHAMSRTPGVLGWPERFIPLAKYAFQYLFVQSEFGLMCPVSVTDTSTYLIERYGDSELKARFLPGMTSTDPNTLVKGTQFMTERTGGSDVGTNRLEAIHDGKNWRLYGDKWFCSAVDADVALLLARPADAPDGTKGLALFAMPRRLDDGSRNAYRIARLKDKMGTRSMASGEIIFEGALAYPVGNLGRGLKQMLDQVNLSRLSHGVRAAAMMRRCLNESLVVSHHRAAFGKRLIDHPLHRRQLMKILLPTEQALSMFVHTADVMHRAEQGDVKAQIELRILTPLLKFRACRDNIKVATTAMEVRGGNGYIEDFVNERLVRDAHIGVLWEGTSNINALDSVQRAAGKDGAHNVLALSMNDWLAQSDGLPSVLMNDLLAAIEHARAFMDEAASTLEGEAYCREASSLFYHVISAALMAGEGIRLARSGGDGRRVLMAHQVLVHRAQLTKQDRQRDLAIEHLLLLQAPISTTQIESLLD
jgi:alkylation response protein AidB-like acyl-CoA dehydrogenase